MQPGDGSKGHPSKSHVHNLTQISARTIAYTCVLVSLTVFQLSFDNNFDRPVSRCGVKGGSWRMGRLSMLCFITTL